MSVNWGRLFTAMITPYDQAGEVDEQKAAELAEHLLQHGSDGLVLWGTTGESPTLSAVEKDRLFVAVKERIGTKGTLIAGTGTNDTRTTIAQTLRAKELGADGVMVVGPYYNKPSQNGLYEHFRAVAESTDLPIMLYNVPSRSGVSIAPETVARLAELPNIAAIKEASGNVLAVSHLRSLLSEDFLVYSGDDPLTLPMLSIGAHGVVSVASHIAGRAVRRMIDSYLAGDRCNALELHEKLVPLCEALFCEVNPVPVKVMLQELGFFAGACRLPLVAPDERKKAFMLDSMQKAGAGLVEPFLPVEKGSPSC
ncbi:4-hydroxy-tetrahydrodipicolinate synthase [Brevibacillus reuszeri]|uniref:4-hydroxy-tetrahydrodipicolinate synthase n=1 Tax=Brevibacillus reuszeri TaxID=54915 RepID=UPI003D1B0718